jgi:uncharacterized protein YeaO (DUF488 family)
MLKIRSARTKRNDGETVIEITRKKGHVLSPSWTLLNRFKLQKKTLGLKTAWDNYLIDFVFEMDNEQCIKEMARIAELAQTQDVVLTCYCNDEMHCHRSAIKRMIEKRFM